MECGYGYLRPCSTIGGPRMVCIRGCKIPSYIHVQNGVICLHFHRFLHISFVHFKLVIFRGLKNIHKNNEAWNETQTHMRRVWERFENRMIELATAHILKRPDGFRERRLDAIWDTLLGTNILYPLKSPFWRWFSFSPGGICSFPGGYLPPYHLFVGKKLDVACQKAKKWSLSLTFQ